MQLIVLTHQQCEEMIAGAIQKAVTALKVTDALKDSKASTPSKEYISATELATELGVTRETVFKWRKDKKFPAYKIGRKTLFCRHEVFLVIKGGRG